MKDQVRRAKYKSDRRGEPEEVNFVVLYGEPAGEDQVKHGR